VLAAAGVAFVIEFVIDKVPILDSLWDLGHTFIRPVVGGLTGAAIAGAQLGRPAAFALAAGLALIGHLTKTTSRLAINMSPEPLTNILASVAEDGLVAVLVALAMVYRRPQRSSPRWPQSSACWWRSCCGSSPSGSAARAGWLQQRRRTADVGAAPLY
jgi:hypothetical protein